MLATWLRSSLYAGGPSKADKGRAFLLILPSLGVPKQSGKVCLASLGATKGEADSQRLPWLGEGESIQGQTKGVRVTQTSILKWWGRQARRKKHLTNFLLLENL